MECEVELCSNDATMQHLCGQHHRKMLANQLDFEDDGTIWDLCSRGHRWTVENTHWESNSKGGRRRRCRECLRLKAERKREEPQLVLPPQPVQPENAAMARAMDSYGNAQAENDTKCKNNPELWMDYTKDTMPTASQAKAMCQGCWFLEACANNARAMQHGWGIWGGERWVYGRIYNGNPEVFHDDD